MALDCFPALISQLWNGNCLNVFQRNVVRVNVMGLQKLNSAVNSQFTVYSVKFTDN